MRPALDLDDKQYPERARHLLPEALEQVGQATWYMLRIRVTQSRNQVCP